MREMIKKTVQFFLLTIVLHAALFSANLTEQFKQANELYKKNQYAGALKAYQQILSDSDDWKVYFNIGNCYFRLQDYVQAKIFYMKAKKRNKVETDIDKNISVVNRKFKDKIPDRKAAFFTDTIGKIESFLPINLISVILFLLIICFNIILFLNIKNRHEKRKRLYIYLLTFLFIFMVFSGFYLSYRIGQQNIRTIGVVLKDNTLLRTGKDSSSKSATINAGLDLRIVEEEADWVRVIVTDEVEGWLKKEDIEII